MECSITCKRLHLTNMRISYVGTTLNLYICGNLCGHFWGKLENHGELTGI